MVPVLTCPELPPACPASSCPGTQGQGIPGRAGTRGHWHRPEPVAQLAGQLWTENNREEDGLARVQERCWRILVSSGCAQGRARVWFTQLLFLQEAVAKHEAHR